MSWTTLLRTEIQSSYATTEKLLAKVDDGALGWKPATGDNWMTMGQLLKHLTESCGAAFRGGLTGDWGIPEGMDLNEAMQLPSAEKLPAVASVAEAGELLQKDQQLALDMLATRSEEQLAHDKMPVPWDPTEMAVGHRLLQFIDHLKQHKGQLFYYLKLQGKPVGTSDLWGM